MEILEQLNKYFSNKYAFLQLLEVTYDKNEKICVVCFLYPYELEDLPNEDRREIENFLKDYLSLNGQLRVKFKRSYLDEKLIKAELKNFFDKEHIELEPYLNMDNIHSEFIEHKVKLEMKINADILNLIDPSQLIKEMGQYLRRRFIGEFDITLIEDEERLPDEIDVEDLEPSVTGVKRYEVEIVASLFGKDIAPKPEYIINQTKPKLSVILAGTISNYTRKAYKVKSGKREGEDKYLYTFTLKDPSPIECVYFCTKSNEKKMEGLRDGTDVLCVGNINRGLSGKLTYYIKKMAVANKKEISEELKHNKNHKRVAEIRPIETKIQANLFEEKPKYNQNIMAHKFVVFDIETTGLDPESCEITEIGAVKIEDGVIKECFSSFVKPNGKIPKEVQDLTHITDEMVANAPPVEAVIQDFYDFSRDCIISGYNVIGFDMKFVKKAGLKSGIKFDNEMLDVLIMARTAGLRVNNYKLSTVVEHLGLSLEGAHRAFNDAHATAQVLLELSKVK